MTIAEQTKIDWTEVNYTIQIALADLRENKDWHQIQAGRRGLERFEYIGGILTRAVQSEVDFRYQGLHDWKTVCERLTLVYKSFTTDSKQGRRDGIKQGKRKLLEYLAGELTRHAMELISFEDRKAALQIPVAAEPDLP